MSKLKYLIPVIAVCSFAMLTACGKGFKGTQILSQENEEQIRLGENELPSSDTVVSVDEQAVAFFAADRERIASQIGAGANASFSNTVEALSMIRVDAFDGASTTTTRMTMTALFSCDEQVRLSGVVNLETLQQGGTVRIGQNQTYEYFVACTDSECGEMVATIRRSGPSGINAVAHYGLVGQRTAVGDFATDYEYTVRRTDVDNFFTKGTVAWYREQCLLADAERQAWGDTNNNTGGIDDTLYSDGFNHGSGSPTWNPQPTVRPEDTATGGDNLFPGSGSGTFPFDDPDQSGPF